VCFSSSYAGEGTTPSPEAAKNIGPVLVMAYAFEAVHPNPPDHLWLDEGNGRVQFMTFHKPVSDPTAQLLFVGEGIKGRFCAESQPDRGKTGFNHFHRINTPATGGGNTHYKPGTVQDVPQPPTPKCK
jgi:hypothetical protein